MRLITILLILVASNSLLYSEYPYGFSAELFEKRNTKDGMNEIFSILSNRLNADQHEYTTCWQLAACYYFNGEFYNKKIDIKKYYFELCRDMALQAVQVNPSGVEGHYWYAIGIAAWSDANGILNSLFNAEKVLLEINKTIALDSRYFDGLPLAIRAKLYNFVPGWPFIGNKPKSYQDISNALKLASGKPTERTVRQFYVEILLNDGHKAAAATELEKAMRMPYDRKSRLEEDKCLTILKKLELELRK